MQNNNHLPVQFNERIHATAVDYGIVFTVNLILIFMQYNLLLELTVLFIVWYLINIVPSFFYKGTSLGKLQAKTIVLNEDYQAVSIKTMHYRNFFVLGMILLTAGLYAPISFYYLSKRLDKRSFHDLLFHTRVVYKNPYLK